MATVDLTTATQVAAWLGVSVSENPTLFAQLATNASQQITTSTGRIALNRVLSGIVEYRDGTGTDSMMLAEWPVRGVTSLVINGAAISASPDGVAGGYIFDNRRLMLLPGTAAGGGWLSGSNWQGAPIFTRGRNNVVVTYSAGYDAATPYPDPVGDVLYNGAPDDLGQAATELAAVLYRRRTRIDIDSKSTVAGQSIRYSTRKWPETVEDVVQSYRRVWRKR